MRLPSIPLAMTFSIAWLLLMMIPAAATPVWHAKISPAGSINFSFNGKEIGPLEPGLFEEVWRNATLKPNYDRDAGINGIYRSMINSPSGIPVDSVINSQPVANGLHLTYQLTPKKEIRTNSIHVSIVIPANLILDGQYVVDGVSKSFPAKFSTVHIYSAPTRTLTLCFPGGEQLNFTFATPTQVMVQDDRQWGGFFSVRIGQQYESATTWPAEKSLNLDFTLTAQGGMDVESTRPITVTANKDWLPYDGKFDVVPGSALDFTNISPRHTPAGKYGRVIATNDGKLAFENQPKTQARFCGVNLCFSAQYLTHEQADMLATRLQRLGYTAVRFHHYENYLIDQSKGDSTRLLKP
ncbi:MAG TPA: hypothetical protein VHV83_03340, partial [Armatimonadota bacterium]|nr:hypothetical protein [Armatimonadota bacterium]